MSEDARALRDRFAALRAAHPMPAKTGKQADKAFFDELSGEDVADSQDGTEPTQGTPPM
jgi:antitoxin MazE